VPGIVYPVGCTVRTTPQWAPHYTIGRNRWRRAWTIRFFDSMNAFHPSKFYPAPNTLEPNWITKQLIFFFVAAALSCSFAA